MDKVHSVQELIERTREMPLARMRFFINEDRREPKCFGIYHDDASDRWIVYKNKADGSRAVRYSGPDEGYAANELWQKIQSEIELRRPAGGKRAKSGGKREIAIVALIAAVVFSLLAIELVREIRKPDRGYYVVDDDVYYYQDDSWYWYDDGDWYAYDAPEDDEWYADSYYGRSYDDFDDDADAFEYSDYYEEPSSGSSSSDSSVYDSWDSGGTDWSSDW